MKNKHLTKAVALISVASLSLTGCSSFINEDVKSYPLAAAMTSAELVDYYAKALDYDSIVSRNVTVHETQYEMKDIEGEKADRLKDLTSQCEELLGQNEYKATEDTLKILSRDTFDYVKGAIDNEVLSNGTVQSIRGALGYYFVDVKYDVSEKAPGSFKDKVNIVGLNGAFHKDYQDKYTVDSDFMSVIVNKTNEYFKGKGIDKKMIFNNSTQVLEIEGEDNDDSDESGDDEGLYADDGADDSDIFGSSSDDVLNAPGDEEETDDVLSNVGTDDSDNGYSADVESVSSSDKSETDYDSIDYTENTQVGNYTIATPSSRRLKLDTALINKVVGSSSKEKAALPSLDEVYEKPSTEGTISGYGIYPAGDDGLKTFGFNREELEGTMTLRYVFKDDSTGSGDILGVNVYTTEEEITNGINVASNNVLLPDFLMSEFKQLIERADRVQANCDLAGLLSGNIFEDIGVGVLRGYRDKATGIQKYMSTIRQVVNRDTANNSYLLEVETTTIEGPRDVDSYGTYKDISYVVIQQQDDKFVITDWCRTSRKLTNEPSIDPDSNVQKRLIALNLAGTISDDAKDSIKAMLSNLYTAGTNRLLRGPKEVVVGGEKKTLEKGMYDCFSSDSSILSSDELEYENSTLRNVLVKHGSDIQSVYSGTVTEWIGGYEDQAEFTTEELVTYQGLDKGYYMQVYYLASMENDEWVIAERTILDEYEVDDANSLATIQERVGQK